MLTFARFSFYSDGLCMCLLKLFLVLFPFFQILMDSREKRPHTVTGNTPNKPSEKRHRELEVEPGERPARRTLAFQGKGSPVQKVMVSFLVILDIVLFFLW